MVIKQPKMAEMTEIEFGIWIETKIIKIQKKIEMQSKESKEYIKMIQELKDEIVILRKDQTDLMEEKNHFKNFRIKLQV